ncbi:hypothetical protein BJF78_15365 [Pseudonocardia sp. CNS-139]|nr:hypothetical protein BJF78_15365 [Pseudonocardia sp. CNS-139]
MVSPPVTGVEAAGAGVLTGLLALGAGAVAVALGRDLARRAIDRANARRWEREWAAVEPRWSGRR